jgi:hypothetical protein
MHRSVSRLLPAALGLVLLAGCGEDPEVARAAAAAQAQAREDAARASAAAFDKAVAEQNWALARAQADVLMMDHPGTEAAKRVAAEYEAIKAKAETARETTRLAALWSYDNVAVGKGLQRSAAIYAKEDVDVDGSGPSQVRLIFRDHPAWGRSSYLVLLRGDFDCYGGCRLQVAVDGKPAKSLAGLRPKTDEAIAMFVEDERALWTLVKDAKTLEIEFPLRGLGKRKAVFEVDGLDPQRMPGWW